MSNKQFFEDEAGRKSSDRYLKITCGTMFVLGCCVLFGFSLYYKVGDAEACKDVLLMLGGLSGFGVVGSAIGKFTKK